MENESFEIHFVIFLILLNMLFYGQVTFKTISLYAKGMTKRDIQDIVRDHQGVESELSKFRRMYAEIARENDAMKALITKKL